MKRNSISFPLAGVTSLVAGMALTSCQAPEKKVPSKPNIIYVMVDDMGYADISCYGQSKFETPNIDQMASEGMRFTQHYAGSTVCAPSRCSLMTGLHTGHAVVRGNREIKPEGQFPMPAETITVAEKMKEAGYATACIGKWGLGFPGSVGDPINQGFDYFFGYNCQREAHHYYPDHLWRNNEKVILEGNSFENKQVYTHDLFTKEAIKYITDNKSNPFFLYLAYTIPHADLDVPDDSKKPFVGKWDEKPFPGGGYWKQDHPRAAFAGMISRLDRDMGRLNQLLVDLGIEENTLIVFTSDNGPHNEGGADPKFFDSNGPLKGIKRDLYEGGIRIPFIAKWKGQIKGGATTDHIASFWDFMPTACEVADVESPKTDGISYLPELLGEKQKAHDYLYWEFHSWSGAKTQAIRKGDWKAVRFITPKGEIKPIQLFNLKTDLGEENNIAEQNKDMIKEMKTLFEKEHVPSKDFPFPHETSMVK